jgi:hypothetical protein
MPGNNFGLYKDDGLGVIKATAREISRSICVPAFSTNTDSKLSQLKLTRKKLIFSTTVTQPLIYQPQNISHTPNLTIYLFSCQEI